MTLWNVLPVSPMNIYMREFWIKHIRAAAERL